MAEKLIHIFKGFLDFLFPQKCLNCGIRGVIICDKCLMSFPSPLILNVPNNRSTFAATSYDDEIVKKIIWLLKYKGVRTLAKPLADLIYHRLKTELWEVELPTNMNSCVIIPVPLSRKRLKERGYNQAELIARSLSDKMSVRFLPDVLYKKKDTVSQVEIKDRKKRLENVKGVFAVKNPEAVKNKIVILIDDVITTGATLNEASHILKQAGAKKVVGVVVARG